MRTADRIGSGERVFEIVTELVRNNVLIELVRISGSVRCLTKHVDAAQEGIATVVRAAARGVRGRADVAVVGTNRVIRRSIR